MRVRGLDYPFALCRVALRQGPSSLYTFPGAGALPALGQGLARDHHQRDLEGFPEFDPSEPARFHAGDPLESDASTSSATRASRTAA